MEEEKKRLDVFLVEKKFANSREKAKEMIQSGQVLVDGTVVNKAGSAVGANAKVVVEAPPMRYVSRGGLKLEKALGVQIGDGESGRICLKDKICMDVGASTGGFTDCMLQNGAAKVYAVDVGTGQLSEKLREDKRVVSLEKTNIRYLTLEAIGEAVDFVSVDVSFISLSLVLKPIRELMKPGAGLVALIKPQFEAGRGKVGKKGVVKEAKVHEEVLVGILKVAVGLGFTLRYLDYSPIVGPEGNIEYLLYAENERHSIEDVYAKNKEISLRDATLQEDDMIIRKIVEKTVSTAWQALVGQKHN